MGIARRGAVFGTMALIAACHEPPSSNAPTKPSFVQSAAAACPTPADVIVHDEASLRAALSGAQPGDVIGVDAFFAVNADVSIDAPEVTLTCATPGAGIFAAPGAGVFEMLNVRANGVGVDRLVLDASAALEGDVFFVDGFVGIRVTNNTVTCALGGSCGFVRVGDAVIADNHFVSAGSFTGVHMQEGIDGSRVERNTVVATAPSTQFGFGGIRVRDGTNVVVADNIVQGPWSSSIATTNLVGSRFENNRLTGAVVNGIRFNVGPPFVNDNVFRSNQVTDAGGAGVFIQWACRNVFVGNNLQGNAGDLGAVFLVTTGANTLFGNGTIVVDEGSFDCSGDGVPDPNVITGQGPVRRGVPFAGPVDGAALPRRGIVVR